MTKSLNQYLKDRRERRFKKRCDKLRIPEDVRKRIRKSLQSHQIGMQDDNINSDYVCPKCGRALRIPTHPQIPPHYCVPKKNLRIDT